MSDEPETELGRVTWYSSEDDGGPDVGLSLGLGGGRALYLGELARATLDAQGVDLNAYPDGWWITLEDVDALRPVAAVCDSEAARALFEYLAALIPPLPSEPSR